MRFARQKKNLTLVLSEKKCLNETKNHNPPSPFKLIGLSLRETRQDYFYAATGMFSYDNLSEKQDSSIKYCHLLLKTPYFIRYKVVTEMHVAFWEPPIHKFVNQIDISQKYIYFQTFAFVNHQHFTKS